MGQRSQIYIRYNVEHYHGLIARYFQWNYGSRMVSKARGIVETIRDRFHYRWMWDDKWEIEKLRRVCDVDFDAREVVLSTDILREVMDEWDGDMSHLFGQPNNDGQLLIDVVDDGPDGIDVRYAFIPFHTEPKPMDGEGYMEWDGLPEDWTHPTERWTEAEIACTRENIQYLRENARLMTPEEVQEFLDHAPEALEPDPF